MINGYVFELLSKFQKAKKHVTFSRDIKTLMLEK